MIKVADLSSWAQAGIAGLTAAIGTIFWAASANSNIHYTQSQVQQLSDQQRIDHDEVIAQRQKLSDIGNDVAEIKGDVKSILHKGK